MTAAPRPAPGAAPAADPGARIVRDALTGRGHLLGPAPAGRKPSAAQVAAGPCPFCGQRERVQPGMRVVSTVAGPVTVHDNPWPVSAAGHQVILLGDAHVTELAQVPARVWAAALLAAWDAFPGCWPLFAANIGPASGASVPHLHAQAVALPGPAPACEDEAPTLAGAGCPLCGSAQDQAPTELARTGGLRVSAAWHSNEVLLAPAAHSAAPTTQDLLGVGALLRRVWVALGHLGWVAGQVVLHHGGPGFHWHVHVTPMSGPAGCLERGGGLTLCRQEPERFVADLRRELTGTDDVP